MAVPPPAPAAAAAVAPIALGCIGAVRLAGWSGFKPGQHASRSILRATALASRLSFGLLAAAAAIAGAGNAGRFDPGGRNMPGVGAATPTAAVGTAPLATAAAAAGGAAAAAAVPCVPMW